MLTLYTGPKPKTALVNLPSSASTTHHSFSLSPSPLGSTRSPHIFFANQIASSSLQFLTNRISGSKCWPIRFPLSLKTASWWCGLDFLAAVSSYPKPDDKIRTTSLKEVEINASNALTCVARLGLSPRAISKVADDTQGRAILEELQADGEDTSFVVVSEEGNSPFTYIIVDNQT